MVLNCRNAVGYRPSTKIIPAVRQRDDLEFRVGQVIARSSSPRMSPAPVDLEVVEVSGSSSIPVASRPTRGSRWLRLPRSTRRSSPECHHYTGSTRYEIRTAGWGERA